MTIKKQAITRTLLRQLSARVELERSLGVGFARCPLSAAVDLTTSLDDEPNSPQTAATTDQHPPLAATTPSPTHAIPQASTQNASNAAPSTPRTASALRAGTAQELADAAGANLPPIAPRTAPDDTAAEQLAPIRTEALVCQKCGLCESRKHVVFDEGDVHSDLVFIDDAPGREEDQTGTPFSGKAGQLLTSMIEKGMQRPRSSVYLCSILKCRPPRNRPPLPDEVRLCRPYLQQQLEIIRPKLIITLGPVAAMILTGQQLSMRRLRGTVHTFRGIPVLPTYHPLFLLRQRVGKRGATPTDRETWEDLKKAVTILQHAPS